MSDLRIERTALGARGSPVLKPRKRALGSSLSVARATRMANELKKRERTSSQGDAPDVRIFYDNEIGRIVMQVVDRESSTVMRQIPSEEVVNFLSKFRTAVPSLVDMTV